MIYGDERKPADGLGPMVGRPRGAEWRALQADGIVWEGQVLLVGDDVDLAARLIVTHRRLAFVRGGSVALEISRSWLRPAPRLLADGTLLLFVSAPGASIFAEPEAVPIVTRDGAVASRQLIAMLAGSGARPIGAAGGPGAPAGRRTLPPLPDASSTRQERRPSGSFGPLREDSPSVAERGRREELRDETVATYPDSSRGFADNRWRSLERFDRPIAERAFNHEAESAIAERRGENHGWLPAPEPDHDGISTDSVARRAIPPVAVGRDRDWNLEPIKGLVPREGRRRRGWSLRIGGLFALLGVAAWVGMMTVSEPAVPKNQSVVVAANASVTRERDLAGATSVANESDATVDAQDAAAVATERAALAIGVGGASTEEVLVSPETAAGSATVAGSNAPPTQIAVEGGGHTVANTDVERAASPSATQITVDDVDLAIATEIPPPTRAPDPTPTATATATAVATAVPTTASIATDSPAATQQVGAVQERARRAATTSGKFRFRVNQVERGATIPRYGLAGSGAGDWVAVVVTARNWTGLPGEIEIDDFTLETPDGDAVAAVDNATLTVAQLAGIAPAFGSRDAVPMPPNAEQELALAFLLPAGTGDVVLRIGEATLPIN